MFINNNMTTNFQHIVALIDRSGSMAGKEEDTIGGINTMLTELKNDKTINDKIFVSIKLFDHEIITLIENKEIDKIELLKKSDFIPRGQTALLDALGITLQDIISKNKNNTLFYNSCLIYVCTDGLENASVSYTKNDVKKLIENGKDENINILYLGANQDSFLEAHKMGINLEGVMNYNESSDTIRSAFASVAKVASRTRSLGGEASFTQAEREATIDASESLWLRPPLLKRQIDIALSRQAEREASIDASEPFWVRPPLLRRQTDIALSINLPPLKRSISLT